MPTKGEIDKEKMFRKIIPSAKAGQASAAGPASAAAPSVLAQALSQQAEAMAQAEAHAAAPQAVPQPVQAPPAAPQPQPVPPSPPMPAASAQQAAPVQQAAQVQQAVPAPVQPQAAPDDATKEYDGPPPYPVNLVELLLDKNYERFRQKVDGCTCEQCRDDVYAITLNKIEPQYVASNHLEEAMQDTRELTTELVTALMNALFIVKRNPRHG